MKALNMTFRSSALKAIKTPIKDMKLLKGGVGDKKLDELQIKKLVREKKAEQWLRQQKAEQRALAKKLEKQNNSARTKASV